MEMRRLTKCLLFPAAPHTSALHMSIAIMAETRLAIVKRQSLQGNQACKLCHIMRALRPCQSCRYIKYIDIVQSSQLTSLASMTVSAGTAEEAGMLFKGNNRRRSIAGNERIALDKALLHCFTHDLASAKKQCTLLAALAPTDCMRLIGLVSACIIACLIC